LRFFRPLFSITYHKEGIMKRSISVLLALIFICAVGIVTAQESTKSTKSEMKMASKEKEMTVKGEVVDVSCYLKHGDKGMGDEHKSCAEACAKAGGPLGILTKDGKLYVSVMPDDHTAGPNGKLMDHIAKQVEATGIVRTKAGIRGIMISKVQPAELPAHQ
jgi:hypothetical protein